MLEKLRIFAGRIDILMLFVLFASDCIEHYKTSIASKVTIYITFALEYDNFAAIRTQFHRLQLYPNQRWVAFNVLSLILTVSIYLHGPSTMTFSSFNFPDLHRHCH